MRKINSAGFTLIELMIVVAIIGILAAIAYPSYQDSVRKGKRSDGQATLMDAMAKQERYYTDNNTYTTDLTDLGFSVDGNNKADSTEAYYKISAAACGTGITACVILTGEGQGGQSSDGDLTYDSLGTKTRDGNTGW